MAFEPFGPVNIGIPTTKLGTSLNVVSLGFDRVRESLKKINKTLKYGGSESTKFARGFVHPFKSIRQGVHGLNKFVPKSIKKTANYIRNGVKDTIGNISKIVPSLLNFAGLFLQFADALGILQPIMDILNVVFQVMGASVMQAILPALQALIDVITDPVFIQMLTSIGQSIGEILTPILMIFARLLMAVAPLLDAIVSIIAEFLVPILNIFSPILDSLAPIFNQLATVLKALSPIIEPLAKIIGGVLAYAFVVVANAIIGLVNVIIGIINLFSWIAGIHLDPIDFLPLPALSEGGIITKPTIVLAGEKGPEKIIPLNKEEDSGKGQEILWATEYTNHLLGITIQEIRKSNTNRRRFG